MIKKSRKEYQKEYRLKNKEHLREQRKEYYLKNIEHYKEYHLKNREHILEQTKKYDLKNREYKKEYRLKNIEHKKEYDKEYSSNPERRKIRQNRDNNRYKTDINYRILKLCRRRVLLAVQGFNKSASTIELIGCTIEELRQHIESKFKPWMNWENQGLGGWDIEHIKACFHFNMADPEQQRACFNWSNLQPMEHIANIKKGTR